MNVRTFLVTVVLLLVGAGSAFAHGEGVILLGSKELQVGAQLPIEGKDLPKNTELHLELRGALEQFPLGIVRTNAEGTFTTTLAIPAEAGAGSYTVVAVAPDGDAAARADLLLTTAATPAGADAHAGMQGMPGMDMGEAGPGGATAEMMVLPVTTGVIEWVVILTFVGVSFLGGAMLLRSGASARR